MPALALAVTDYFRGLGDPAEVCAAYRPSLIAALGAWWDEHFTCTEMLDDEKAARRKGNP